MILLLILPPTRAQRPDFSLAGFATLNGGTTGGKGGTEVVVGNYADLKKYAENASTPYIIKINGSIKGTGSVASGTYQGSINVASDKSIIGMDNTAFLDGVGLKMKGGTNIVIQNIKMSFISIAEAIPEGSGDIPGIYSELGDEGRAQILVNGGDLISISSNSRNIWIDHCELYSEDPAVQPNKDLYDGLIDIKNQTGFITISWCYFHDHYKVHLIGSNPEDLYEDRKITFHHNRYENVNSRLPSYRGSVGHVFNNYINKGLYSCINSSIGACVRVEKNYFEQSRTTVYSSTGNGFAEIIDNKEVYCTFGAPYPGSCTATIEYRYDHVLHSDVESVKDIVIRHSGVEGMNAPALGTYPGISLSGVNVRYIPSGSKLFIDSPGPLEFEVEVFDILGRLILHDMVMAQEEIILRPMTEGLHFVRLSSEGNCIIRKFIIE
jgi:pectate lyase